MKFRNSLTTIAALGAFAFAPAALRAEVPASAPPTDPPASTSSSNTAVAALPEAPMPQAQQQAPVDDGVHRSRYTDVIDNPTEPVPHLGVGGKMILSVRESVLPFTLLAAVGAAGINHLDQGDPQYGEGSEAFGKRVGAAVALEVSGNIFSDGILASAFREDPRYYRVPDASFGRRVFHPIADVFITRTDDGNNTVNFSNIIGRAGAAYLTQVYYPPSSANNQTSLNTFGYSLAGVAAANLVSEFGPDIWHKIHHPSN